MEPVTPEPKQRITFGKFQNVDLRVAEVTSAPMADGTKARCRLLELDLGDLGRRQSVGQFAELEESELVGVKVIAVVNLAEREMGPHISEALVLGTHHPESPEEESQSIPLRADPRSANGSAVF